MLVQRTEIGAPGDFDKCESTEEIVDTLLAYNLNPSYQVATEQERQQLIDLLERQFAETGSLIDAIKARPVARIPTRPALTHGKGKPAHSN